MGRWEPDARGRLRQAAITLYATRGFEDTTVADIAEAAGVTERTFFRHFPDKREVLFAGSERLLELAVAAVDAAPSGVPLLDLMVLAVEAAGGGLPEDRDYARLRAAVVAANTSLQERELLKMWMLGTSLREALEKRGVEQAAAGVAATTAVSVFSLAFDRWVGDDETRPYAEIASDYWARVRFEPAP